MNGYESSDTDDWEESLEIVEYLSDEEWVPKSHLIPVIWYNPLQPQGSWSDDKEDQKAAIDLAPTISQWKSNQDEPKGVVEEGDLATMPYPEKNARIVQHLAEEQE